MTVRPWIGGAWPEYRRLRQYHSGRIFGPLQIEWNPDHAPWPQVHLYQAGSYAAVALTLGPLGPDPVLSIELRIPRPGTLA